jgi:succinyl-diaminopimelate desuccinylase
MIMKDRHTVLRARIDAIADDAVRFLQDFTRIDTYNPPGDTRAAADFIAGNLQVRNVPFKIVAPQRSMPNILATTEFAAPGRHLVLNGHIDVFPPGERALWSHDPLSGDIIDGAVYGRGTVDMKCGTTASIFTYLLLRDLHNELRGRLTLTIVSDEETGGRWGSDYLVEHHAAEVLGDCVLSGEPSSPWTVRFGEKAPIWLKFHIKTQGAHGAYTHLSKSATRIAARLMLDLESLERIQPVVPPTVAQALEAPGAREAIERGLGNGAAEIVGRVTVNFGVVQGGVKINMLPGDCIVEADIRLPVGGSGSMLRAEIDRILQNYPEVIVEGFPQDAAATYSDPRHEMVRHIQDNAERLIGYRPPATVSLGGTDCRFWRAKGVPAYVYGCSPTRMGAPDEAVLIDEFLHVLKTHALSAMDFLGAQ